VQKPDWGLWGVYPGTQSDGSLKKKKKKKDLFRFDMEAHVSIPSVLGWICFAKFRFVYLKSPWNTHRVVHQLVCWLKAKTVKEKKKEEGLFSSCASCSLCVQHLNSGRGWGDHNNQAAAFGECNTSHHISLSAFISLQRFKEGAPDPACGSSIGQRGGQRCPPWDGAM